MPRKQDKKTITCLHCRYERPKAAAQCPMCGYPWPWLKKKTPPRGV